MRTRSTEYGIGGYDPALPNNNIVVDETLSRPGLGTDRETLPADNTTVATLHYMANDPSETTANWTVNGVAHVEALVNGESELEVATAVPGTIEVVCNGLTLTLRAI